MSTLGTEQPSQEPINPETPAQEQVIDWEKRYKDLQSHYDKNRVEWEKQKAELRKQSSVFVPPKTPEELEAFRNENPDWMGVIETVAQGIASNSIQDIQKDIDAQKEQVAIEKIRAAHPDVSEVTSSDDFNQWATEQGPEIQAWLQDTKDASKVIRALNYYKAMRSPAPKAPDVPADTYGAQAVSTHGSVVTPQTSSQPRVFTRAQIAAMHVDEYAKYQEEIEQASRLGLIK